jgi:hypothetical protein
LVQRALEVVPNVDQLGDEVLGGALLFLLHALFLALFVVLEVGLFACQS